MTVYASVSGYGGIATQIHCASIEGLKILEEEGNAFDAAITASSLLTVLLPNTSSIGGDGFILGIDNGDNIVAYNGSGRAPQDFPVESYLFEKPVRGPLTVTVPGLVELWEWVNENYGSVDLCSLLSKATSMAKNGFYIQEPLARKIELSMPALGTYESWKKVFAWAKTGSHMSFPRLAKIYMAIAKRGADAFYRSTLTEEIVEELKQYGVPLTYEDFAEHKGEKGTPTKSEYNGYELYELPPNTQGITTLQLLKTMELAQLSNLAFGSPERIRSFLELAVGAYEDRDRFIGDPNYYETPVEKLLSIKYLRERLDMDSRLQGCLNSDDTTFFVVADKYGNIVGFIQSIYHSFGSEIIAHDIPFQSRGAGFAKSAGFPNSPAPKKRPLHTLLILLTHHSNEGDCVIGCAAGDLRPQIHAEVFTNMARISVH